MKRAEAISTHRPHRHDDEDDKENTTPSKERKRTDHIPCILSVIRIRPQSSVYRATRERESIEIPAHYFKEKELIVCETIEAI